MGGERTERADAPLIAVIGGGAAGLAAAIAAGETGCGQVRVAICEASDRVGRSILATGNGRCNFSNARLIGAAAGDLAAWYRNAAFVERALAAVEGAFPGDGDEGALLGSAGNAVLRFFSDHGLVWREEGEGRLYPLANKASSVLDVLREAAARAEVEAITEFRAWRVIVEGGDSPSFLVRADDGRKLRADAVIIAVGGAMEEGLLEGFGLPFASPRPVLGPLAVDASGKRETKRLDNIRVKAAATLLREGKALRREQGEVLFRSYGLSGIAIFDLSRGAQAGDEISLDLLPQLAEGDAGSLLRERVVRANLRSGADPTYDDILRGMVLPLVARMVCERGGVRSQDAVEWDGLARVGRTLRDLRFTVEGSGDERQCQVMRGGVAVDALDPATLEVRAAPGSYVVGEAADVDGACGGFNLHWAWASGLSAGRAAALAAMGASAKADR